MLLEQFVPGPEVAVEGMVWGGVLEILAIFDKPDHPDGPYFEETIYVTPSLLDRATQDEVARVTQAAITAIGLQEGPIHAELRSRRRQAFGDRGGRPIDRWHLWAGAQLWPARHLSRDSDPAPRARSTASRPSPDHREPAG